MSRHATFAWALAACLLLGALPGGGCRHAARPRQPNAIFLISIDTVRADRLQPFGGAVATPALDALARDGVLFERAFSHSPQTFPSHASILTGLLPFEHGARDNVGFTLADTAPSIAERLRGAGYATGAAVSSYVLRRETGLARGFDFYDSSLKPPSGPEVSIAQVQRPGAETVAVAKQWLAAQPAAKPIFFFLHLYEPHAPYAPPPPYREQYASAYDGELAYADALVGDFVAFIRSQGRYDSSLVVLLSDHGEGLGDHGEREHGIFLYQGVAHVPLVVKFPGGARAGMKVRSAVQLIDVAPTMAALAGVAADGSWRGAPLTEDPERPGAPVRAIYSESMYPRYHFGWKELYALTDGRFRYIRAPRDELYDLDADPREERNLAASRAATRQAMRSRLDALVERTPIATPADLPPEEMQKFQALGYIGVGWTDRTARDDDLPDPKDKIAVFAQYRDAIEAARDRDYERAIRLYKSILADNPRMLDVWEHLASALASADRHGEALLVTRRMVDLNPRNSQFRLQLARLLTRGHKFDEAARQAREALEEEPARARELLARIAFERGAPAEAGREADEAIRRNPALPLPFYVKGLIAYGEGRMEEALPLFEQAAEKLQARPGLRLSGLSLHLADALARVGRADEAEHAFRAEIRDYPDNTEAWLRLAAFYRARGRRDTFTQLVDEFVRRVPTPRSYALAIRALTDAGETDLARRLARDAPRRSGPVQ